MVSLTATDFITALKTQQSRQSNESQSLDQVCVHVSMRHADRIYSHLPSAWC